MRNTGLHRGAEFIRQTQEALLRPNEEAIVQIYSTMADLRAQDAELWQQRAAAPDAHTRAKLDAVHAALEQRINALLAELERKQTLKKVFEHLIAHRATEVVQKCRELTPEIALTYGESAILAEVEQYAYA